MYRSIKFTGIVFFCILLASCQKEMSNENNSTTPPPPPQNILDSNYLDKIYIIDFDGNNNLLDTLDMITHVYDSHKRIIKRIDSVYDFPAQPIYEVITYDYNGTDTLPYRSKAIRYGDGGSGINDRDTTITYFTFNNAGQRVKDSVYHHSYLNFTLPFNYYVVRTIIKYSFSLNKIYADESDSLIIAINVNPNINSSKDTATLDSRGNIISTSQGKTYTYDSKPNPMARLSNSKTFRLFTGLATDLLEFVQPNNLLTMVDTNFTGSVFQQNWLSHIYNTSGYLTEVNDVLPPSSSGYYKFRFIYRAL